MRSPRLVAEECVAPDWRLRRPQVNPGVCYEAEKSGSESYFRILLATKACGRPRWMGSFTERRNSALTPTMLRMFSVGMQAI